MKEKLNKNLIIQILFAIAVVLLIANLLIGKFKIEENNNIITVTDSLITPAVADSIFLVSLKSFNIKDSYIRKPKTTKKNNLTDLYLYKIEIPYNLPNILVIKEIYQNFSKTKLRISSKEIKEDESTLLEINNGNKLFLSSLFTYNKDLSHMAGSINLYVTLTNDVDTEKINSYLDLNRNITYLFTPSSNNLKLADKIINNNASYGLIIDNNIEELNYQIKNNFNDERIEQGISYVLDNFPKLKLVYFPKGFLPNNKIKNDFKKYKIRTINSNSPINLTNDYKSDFNKMFNSYVINSNPNDTLGVVLSSDNFNKIIPELKILSKMGYKFVSY